MNLKWSVIRTVTVHISILTPVLRKAKPIDGCILFFFSSRDPHRILLSLFKGFSSCSHAKRELSFTLISIHKTRSRSLQEFVVTNQQYDEIYASDASFIAGPKIAMDSQYKDFSTNSRVNGKLFFFHRCSRRGGKSEEAIRAGHGGQSG